MVNALNTAKYRFRVWYYYRRAVVEYWFKFDVLGALYCIRMAWGFITGKLMFVTTHESVSNGGYKYKSLVISKRPLSARNTYEDLP